MANNIYKKAYMTLLILMVTTITLHAAQASNQNTAIIPQQPVYHSHHVTEQCDTTLKPEKQKCSRRGVLGNFIEQETLEPQEYPILGNFIKEEVLAPQSIAPPINLTDLKHEAPQKNAKKHTCGQCSKSFAYKSALKEHQIVHTNERPW